MLCLQNGAKILLNGRTMEEGEKEELHHNDRYACWVEWDCITEAVGPCAKQDCSSPLSQMESPCPSHSSVKHYINVCSVYLAYGCTYVRMYVWNCLYNLMANKCVKQSFYIVTHIHVCNPHIDVHNPHIIFMSPNLPNVFPFISKIYLPPSPQGALWVQPFVCLSPPQRASAAG